MSLSIYRTRHAALRWQPLRRLSHPIRPAPVLCAWLEENGSLTARLMTQSQGHFKVRVLRQLLARPSLSEQRCLGMARGELALVREVVLMGYGQPWVFARSVLPLRSLTGDLRHLRKQDARPLGAFLFSQPKLCRSEIAVSQISRHHDYVPASLQGDKKLWGRRSVFYVKAKPLLVSEVFLDTFVASL